MRLAQTRGVRGLAATKITSDSADAPADVQGKGEVGGHELGMGLHSSASDSSVTEPGVRLPGCDSRA